MPNYEVEITFDKPTSCRKSYSAAARERNTAIVLAGTQVPPGWHPTDIKVFEVTPSAMIRGDSRVFDLSFDTHREPGDLEYSVEFTLDDGTEEKLTEYAPSMLQALTKALYNLQDVCDLGVIVKCKITHMIHMPATRTLVTE